MIGCLHCTDIIFPDLFQLLYLVIWFIKWSEKEKKIVKFRLFNLPDANSESVKQLMLQSHHQMEQKVLLFFLLSFIYEDHSSRPVLLEVLPALSIIRDVSS